VGVTCFVEHLNEHTQQRKGIKNGASPESLRFQPSLPVLTHLSLSVELTHLAMSGLERCLSVFISITRLDFVPGGNSCRVRLSPYQATSSVSPTRDW